MVSFSKRRQHSQRPHLRAAPYFESISRRLDPLVSNPLVSMFTQDVPNAVTPYRWSDKDGYDAKIIGAESEVIRAKSLLATIERHSSHGTKELVASAVREIAQALAWYGLAPYEIWVNDGSEEQNADEDEEGREGSIGLSLFTPQNLFRLPKICVQLVPRADRERWGKSVIILPRKILWLVSMPKQLGGYRGYRKLLKRLARFNWTAPPFWQEDLGRGLLEKKTAFDFSHYRRRIDIYQSRVTRKWGWGWNGRDTTSEKWTEFGLFYRIITFKWAQAVLREHILKELNLLLRRLKIDAEIQITGLPTPEEILQARQAMTEGTISYSKAYDKVSVP
jgi:hypothetical protein